MLRRVLAMGMVDVEVLVVVSMVETMIGSYNRLDSSSFQEY